MLFHSLILFFSCIFLTACDTLGFYVQGVGGHLKLMSQSRPLEHVISDGNTPAKTRQDLQTARKAKRFAKERLQLADNNSYASYVDLKRDKATWNVVATPELSMQPYQSCFPVTGCLSYRGYFKKPLAEHFASWRFR